VVEEELGATDDERGGKTQDMDGGALSRRGAMAECSVGRRRQTEGERLKGFERVEIILNSSSRWKLY
jgi:hypothetical protein